MRRFVVAVIVALVTVAAAVSLKPQISRRSPVIGLLTQGEWRMVGHPVSVQREALPGRTLYLVLGRQYSCYASTTFVEEGCAPNRYFGGVQTITCSPYQDMDAAAIVYGLIPAAYGEIAWSDGAVRPISGGLLYLTISKSGPHPVRVYWHGSSEAVVFPHGWRQPCATSASQALLNQGAMVFRNG